MASVIASPVSLIRSLTYGPLRAGRKAVRALCLVAGLGAAAAPAAADPVEIVALGDSLTAGYGLKRAQGFVPQLQDWLRAQGEDVRIVNAGVSGDTTAGGLARAEWSLSEGTDAMILALGGNDLLRGIDPAATRANLAAILDIAAGRDLPVLLVGLYASRNYGAGYKQRFEAIHPDLAQEYGTLYEPNWFQGLGGADDDPASYRQFMQSDGIHPNAEGVQRIVARIGPQVRELIARASAE